MERPIASGAIQRPSERFSTAVPKITNTMQDLGWEPKVTFEDALRSIFEAYRNDVAEARKLMD